MNVVGDRAYCAGTDVTHILDITDLDVIEMDELLEVAASTPPPSGSSSPKPAPQVEGTKRSRPAAGRSLPGTGIGSPPGSWILLGVAAAGALRRGVAGPRRPPR